MIDFIYTAIKSIFLYIWGNLRFILWIFFSSKGRAIIFEKPEDPNEQYSNEARTFRSLLAKSEEEKAKLNDSLRYSRKMNYESDQRLDKWRTECRRLKTELSAANKKIAESEANLIAANKKIQTAEASRTNSEKGLANWKNGPLQNIILCAINFGAKFEATGQKLQFKEVETYSLKVGESTGYKANPAAHKLLWKNYKYWCKNKDSYHI